MFNTLKKVLENKTFTESEANKVPDFLLRRWLTGDNRLIDLACTLNTITIPVSNYTVLKAIAYALRGQIKFIKFPSNAKQTTEEIEGVANIAKFFKVSENEAKEYLVWMQNHCPDEIETLKVICKDL